MAAGLKLNFYGAIAVVNLTPFDRVPRAVAQMPLIAEVVATMEDSAVKRAATGQPLGGTAVRIRIRPLSKQRTPPAKASLLTAQSLKPHREPWTTVLFKWTPAIPLPIVPKQTWKRAESGQDRQL